VRASGIAVDGLDGVAFDLHARGQTRRARLPLVGRHFVTAALAAAAAAFEAGCSWEDVSRGLATVPATQRLVPHRLPGGITLLDDAYNASPDSARAALEVLGAQPGRRIAVLGDMLELGDFAPAAHLEVGALVPGRADVLVTVGELGREIARGAREAGVPDRAVHECASAPEAVRSIGLLLRDGDTLLVKASHGMHLETLVTALSERRAQDGTE
jgi:UDP-N-acetylmuramoyl-tripeptide--D-alanyl-D-alanine ligase